LKEKKWGEGDMERKEGREGKKLLVSESLGTAFSHSWI